MIAASFLKKVELTINQFKMLSNGQKVVVAVSGGPDSAALLHALLRLKEKYQILIWAAHLNHLIRGKEAEEDERWVREFTASLGVPLICERIDVSLIAREKKGGVEQVAREVRYRFLEEVARQVSADKIAVGHTASDQAETFLMRVIRGSGSDGLAGISPIRGKIIRPLIRVFRWEVESYCQQENILPRRDSTN
ncbi:tRNA lysidine(34) synthetase TilS, partial [Candidatus Aerophobetes bacterium]|nr:tRNA lysidine(34) synthetase TilS [Candidatus Aerophobetes bacterium]